MGSLFYKLICQQNAELCQIRKAFKVRRKPVVLWGSSLSTVKLKDASCFETRQYTTTTTCNPGGNLEPQRTTIVTPLMVQVGKNEWNLWHNAKLFSRSTYSSKSSPVSVIRGFRTSLCLQQVDQNDDELLGKGDKVLRVKLKAVRLDTVLKAGLGLSRNKIEKALYQDRVRINGLRPQKKSQTVNEGDEIDIVRGYNQLNPDKFIDVSRVEIEELGDEPDNDESGSDSDSDDETNKIPAVLRRSKLLTVRNYALPWKGSSQD